MHHYGLIMNTQEGVIVEELFIKYASICCRAQILVSGCTIQKISPSYNKKRSVTEPVVAEKERETGGMVLNNKCQEFKLKCFIVCMITKGQRCIESRARAKQLTSRNTRKNKMRKKKVNKT